MRLGLLAWLTVIALVLVLASGAKAQDLTSRLQAAGLTPDGPAQQAADLRSLFRAINGGAEPYIKHGFLKAKFQTYKAQDGNPLNLDIFEMKDPAAAKAVYAEKAGGSGNIIEIKDHGVLEDYYLLFRQGRFFVALTGETTDKKVHEKLTSVARIIEKWLADKGKNPLF